MTGLRAVVLDWAGTTIDHGVLSPVAVFRQVFSGRGVEITDAEARAPMGLYKLDHFRAIAFEGRVAARWADAHGRGPTEEDVVEMFEASRPIQVQSVVHHAALIAGTREAVEEMRRRGYAIGSTTGYARETADALLWEATRQGYTPDCIVTPDEVPAGRPEPWMLLRNMERLRVFPPAAVVKIGDTPVDIDEGRNAGTWAIGLSRSGSDVGLTEVDFAALPVEEQRERVSAAERRLLERGAHAVVETIAEVMPALDAIEARFAGGERP